MFSKDSAFKQAEDARSFAAELSATRRRLSEAARRDALGARPRPQNSVSVPVGKLEEWVHFLRQEASAMEARDTTGHDRYSSFMEIGAVADDIESFLGG